MASLKNVALFAAIPVLLFSGCTEDKTPEVTPSASSSVASSVAATPEPTPTPFTLQTITMTPEKDLQMGAVQADETVALITTNHGPIVLRFFADEAPKTVENFTGLAEKKYYDGVGFHRVIDGFMIQGGDPDGTGRGGESFFGNPFEDEFSDKALNNRGSISMANSGPATNGSQFFINTVNNNFLDNRHSVFGEVIAGMETVDAISDTKTLPGDKPAIPVVMESVEIMTFSEYEAK